MNRTYNLNQIVETRMTVLTTAHIKIIYMLNQRKTTFCRVANRDVSKGDRRINQLHLHLLDLLHPQSICVMIIYQSPRASSLETGAQSNKPTILIPNSPNLLHQKLKHLDYSNFWPKMNLQSLAHLGRRINLSMRVMKIGLHIRNHPERKILKGMIAHQTQNDRMFRLNKRDPKI